MTIYSRDWLIDLWSGLRFRMEVEITNQDPRLIEEWLTAISHAVVRERPERYTIEVDDQINL